MISNECQIRLFGDQDEPTPVPESATKQHQRLCTSPELRRLVITRYGR
ncbi:MAG: hypothetical protein RMJ55_20520 [Roseiflexaceae bacterium]|nr:hypothetical protein [Roseiflexaceae bacterium]